MSIMRLRVTGDENQADALVTACMGCHMCAAWNRLPIRCGACATIPVRTHSSTTPARICTASKSRSTASATAKRFAQSPSRMHASSE
jgi:hypothetical protein